MSVYVRKVRQGWRVCVEDRDGFTDWPIQYDNGQIAYDHPFRHTKQDKRDVERTYKAMTWDGPHKWAIWEWLLENGPGSLEDRTRFRLVRLCRTAWPGDSGEFAKVAKAKGYELAKKDGTLVGDYYASENGDCLVCFPRGQYCWSEF